MELRRSEHPGHGRVGNCVCYDDRRSEHTEALHLESEQNNLWTEKQVSTQTDRRKRRAVHQRRTRRLEDPTAINGQHEEGPGPLQVSATNV